MQQQASLLTGLKTTRVSQSRIDSVDFENLGFGNVFADHMFVMECTDKVWHSPRLEPFGPISLHPANSALHYGQAVFEGLKAYRGVDDRIRVFRSDKNAERLVDSCDRLCIPRIDVELFVEAIVRLVALDHQWVPHSSGQSLYIRPLVFSDEGHLEVRPANRFKFVIFSSPVRSYFDTGTAPVSLKAEESYTRSAPGGVGFAKAAGNYGASLYPGQQGREAGYAQVLWLDSTEHRFVEEVGAMNIFFRFEDRVVTPDLHGTILPGVTRDSVITLLRDAGHTVEERRVAIDEIIQGSTDGSLREAFGAGTAAVIAPVGLIGFKESDYPIGNGHLGEMTSWLYEQITGIQYGQIKDKFDWCRLITPLVGAAG